MAYTLSDALQRVLTKLGMLYVDVATGGSATTAVFSHRANNGDKDNFLKSGVLFVIRTTDGLTPQGKYARISAYVASTATITCDTVTDTIGAGDIIGFADETYPFRRLVELGNQVLRTIKIGLTYTSLTTAASQTEYSLPVTVKRTRPSRVDLQTNSDSDDNQWKEIYGWEYVPATAGTAALLVLPYQPDSGKSLRVWYNGDHPTLDTYEDVVSETIDEELFASMVTAAALEWYNTSNSGADQFLLDRENKANADVNQRKALSPTYTNKKRPKLIYGE